MGVRDSRFSVGSFPLLISMTRTSHHRKKFLALKGRNTTSPGCSAAQAWVNMHTARKP
jgi:hypothetical protein